jgi:hypothetical protein
MQVRSRRGPPDRLRDAIGELARQARCPLSYDALLRCPSGCIQSCALRHPRMRVQLRRYHRPDCLGGRRKGVPKCPSILHEALPRVEMGSEKSLGCMEHRKQKVWQAASCLLCAAVAWRFGFTLDGTEFGGGRITRPLLDLQDVGGCFSLSWHWA